VKVETEHCRVTCGADVASFIEKKDNWVPLAVIGSADADRRLAKVVGSHNHHIFPAPGILGINHSRGIRRLSRRLHRRRALRVGGQHRIDESLSRLHMAVCFRQG
jgi:hypothetical protein